MPDLSSLYEQRKKLNNKIKLKENLEKKRDRKTDARKKILIGASILPSFTGSQELRLGLPHAEESSGTWRGSDRGAQDIAV